MNRPVFVALSLTSALLRAQSAPAPAPASAPAAEKPALPPAQRAALDRLRGRALASNHTWTTLAYLCNSVGPRPAGSPQHEAAAKYVAERMKAAGLTVRLQKATVSHWVRGEERAELTDWPGMTPGTTQKILVTALGRSVATPPEGITAEALIVDDFEALEALPREKVAGKIVVFNHPFDERMAADGRGGGAYGEAIKYRTGGAVAAARKGAVAALNRAAGPARYRLVHTGVMRYKDDAPKIPAGSLTAEDAIALAELASRGPVTMHLTLTPRTLPDAEGWNVIGDLSGREHPEQVVILSGHLDSWDLGTGALDDGAGVAASLGAVEAIARSGLKPRRTLRVIAWVDEEITGAGADAYLAEQKANLATHVAAVEMDMGAGHSAGFSLMGSAAAAESLDPLKPVLAPLGATLVERTDGCGADIEDLGKAGVPCLEPLLDSRTYFNYHHTPADTLDKVAPGDLAENAAALAVLGFYLADAEVPIPRN